MKRPSQKLGKLEAVLFILFALMVLVVKPLFGQPKGSYLELHQVDLSETIYRKRCSPCARVIDYDRKLRTYSVELECLSLDEVLRPVDLDFLDEKYLGGSCE